MTDAEKALVQAALSLSRHDMSIREGDKLSALLAARQAVIAERTPPEAAATCRELWVSAWQAERVAREYSRNLDDEEAETIRMAAYEVVWPGSSGK